MKVCLDTNIFVYALEREDEKGQAARKVIEKIKKGNLKAYISVLVIHEVLVGIYKRGLSKYVSSILEFISFGGLITIVNYDRQIALVSALLRAEYGLRTADSIHLATAVVLKAKLFITSDKRIPRKIEGLKVDILK